MSWKKVGLSALGLIIFALLGFVAWGSVTNPIMPEATLALQSDAKLHVSTTGGWLVFQPSGSLPETGLIFYPGGKVDYRAYAPYARAIAEQGYLVIIPQMPLNVAVFDIEAAGRVMAAYRQVKHWAVGGHSLGGSMAANYALRHAGQIQGLILLASYPASADDLSKSGLRVVSIYGTRDSLTTGPKIDASRALLPADTLFVAIKGGNHGQFGDYGIQSGDGLAQISRAAQQAQAVKASQDLLAELSGK